MQEARYEHEGYAELPTDEVTAMTPCVAVVDKENEEAYQVTPIIQMMPNGLLCTFGQGETIYMSYISALHISEALSESAIEMMKDTGALIEIPEYDEEFD